ncbi:MAG: hypothetical protein GY842_24265 [bacterium]|nr:hypothetical protein [bacterium]
MLKSDVFPLANILRVLLEIGRRGMACPIEIEFAVNMKAKPMEFGFLQIRPTVADEACVIAGEEVGEGEPDDAICYSPNAMGNGTICGICDLVYVDPENFDSGRTREIAAEIGRVNETLRQAGRAYVLIGPGRWGSSDPWLGIPVVWEQISAAQVIVESSLHGFVITPSQGTHFFQNLTSFRIGYLTVNPTAGGGRVDWEWLGQQQAVGETQYLRHVRVDEPVLVKLNGRTRQGVILRAAVGDPPLEC